MRILANYSFRNNGDSYQVTFETSGDVPKDQADSTADELFQMAKSAIQRQVNPAVNQTKPHKEDVVIPEPKAHANGNGNGNGKYTNGNGNGKPHPKESEAPISAKQQSLLLKLSKEKGQRIEGLHAMSMSSASEKIKELLAA